MIKMFIIFLNFILKVLLDVEKRKIYDKYGEEGLSKGDVGGDLFFR